MPHSGWAGSTRRRTLPADWTWRRREVAQRAGGRCEWPGWEPGRTARLAGDRCDALGNDCDHIGDPLNHNFDNLQWLCHTHHHKKTLTDQRTRRRPTERRPPERHPGLRGKK